MLRVKQYIATLLLSAFIFVLVPKEAFHMLTSHEDTIDSYNGYTAISTKHIHCEILQFQFSGFTQPHDIFIPSSVVFLSSLITYHTGVVATDVADALRSRGPPAVASMS